MISGSLFQTLRDILLLTRVWNLMIVFLTQLCVIIFLVSLHAGQEVSFELRLLLLLFSTGLIAAGGYAINDYYDVKIDFLNKPEKVVVGRYVKRRTVMLLHIALSFTGILMGYFVSISIAVVNLCAGILLWLYSNRLKCIPLIGNLAVAFLAGLVVLTVGIFYSCFSSPIILYSVFAFFFTLVREIIKDIQDMKGDEAFGCKTLPIVLGFRKTKMFIYGLSIIFILTLPYYIDVINRSVMAGFFVAISLALINLFYKLYLADTKSQFSWLSAYCKWIMVGGIISMFIFAL